MGAYEIAGALIKRGALNEDLFFDVISSVNRLWRTAQPWVNGLRDEMEDPAIFDNVEWLADHMQEWQRHRRTANNIRKRKRVLATAGAKK